MTVGFTNLAGLEWAIYSLLGIVIFVANIPQIVCKSGVISRYEKNVNAGVYQVWMSAPYWSYLIIWFIGLVFSILSDGFTWEDGLTSVLLNQTDAQTALVWGVSLKIVSYFFAAFWTHLFFGKMLPRIIENEENPKKESLCAHWALAALIFIGISFLTSVGSWIAYAFVSSLGLLGIGYSLALLLIFIPNLLVVIQEYKSE